MILERLEMISSVPFSLRSNSSRSSSSLNIVEKIFFAKWFNVKSIDYYVIIVPNGTILTDGTYEIDME